MHVCAAVCWDTHTAFFSCDCNVKQIPSLKETWRPVRTPGAVVWPSDIRPYSRAVFFSREKKKKRQNQELQASPGQSISQPMIIIIHAILTVKVSKEVFQFNGLISVVLDATSTEQQELFTQKLQQCCVIFDFLDSVTDLKSKEIKRATLNELVDYVSTNRGVLVESAYPEITDMVSALVLVEERSVPFKSQRTASLNTTVWICNDGAGAPNCHPQCYNDSWATFSTKQSPLAV